jgi:hypothetical protein
MMTFLRDTFMQARAVPSDFIIQMKRLQMTCGTAVNSKNQVFFVEFGAPKIATINNAMHIHKIRATRYGLCGYLTYPVFSDHASLTLHRGEPRRSRHARNFRRAFNVGKIDDFERAFVEITAARLEAISVGQWGVFSGARSYGANGRPTAEEVIE